MFKNTKKLFPKNFLSFKGSKFFRITFQLTQLMRYYRNFQNLIHFEKQGTALQNAIPTPDHYLPLIYTLGLKEKSEEISLFNDELIGGSLSMTSVFVG